MAGFAIDLGDAGSEFAQGVSAPSATEMGAAARGLDQLTAGLFGVANSYARAKASSAPTQAQTNKAQFANFARKIDDLRGTDETQLNAKLTTIRANYASQGNSFGASEVEYINSILKINYAAQSVDPVQEAAMAANKQLTDNPGFLYLAEQKLTAAGKPFTNQDIAAVAYGNLKASEAAATYIATSSNIDKQEFLESYVPHANKVLEDIRALAMVGLQVETGGGDISPESIVQLRTKFDIAKSQLTKPANIETDQWQAVGSQITTLDSLLTRLETYDAEMLKAETAAAMEPISALLLRQAKELGESDPVLAKALLSDKVDWSAYVAEKWTDVLKTLKNTEIKDTVYTDLNVFGVDDVAEFVKPEDGSVVTTVVLHNEAMVTAAEDRSATSRNDAIQNALDFKVRLTTPLDVNRPEHRDNFLNGVGQATVNIATSTQLISPATLDTVFADETIEKLNIIKMIDPDGHAIAVAQLKDAVLAQANIFNTTASGALTDSYFNVNSLGIVEYDIDKKFLQGQVRNQDAQPLVVAAAQQYYNGNISSMIRDRGRKVESIQRSEIESEGFKFVNALRELSMVEKYAAGQKKYVGMLKKIGVDTTQMEKLLLKPVQAPVNTQSTDTSTANVGLEEANPFVIQTTLSESQQKAAFDALPSGSYFIDPSDGITYRKGE